MKKNIAIVGLGYVGLPLALLAEEKGFNVVGIDLDQKKLDMLNKKVCPIDDIDSKKRLKKSKIDFSDDFKKLQTCDIAIICVPTPVDEKKNPDISLVENASINSAKNLKKGTLLIVESTINPGVCDEIIIPSIEAHTEHKVNTTIGVAHCPERINPGDPKWHVGNINRVLGASSDEALEIAYEFYDKLIDATIKKMANIKEAEACKVVENSFRDINLAFVNELAMSFSKLGINVKNVIDGAATKPFAFMAHYPGVGVGGHCIPVDPYYLIEYARNNGFEHKFLSLARSINENMPIYTVDKLEEALIQKSNISLKGATVAVLGLAYKANVGDDRESPAYVVISQLTLRGCNVVTYDPHLIDKSTHKTLEEVIKDVDAVILVTNHEEFLKLDIKKLSKIPIFIDGRNAFSNCVNQFENLGIYYQGIGT